MEKSTENSPATSWLDRPVFRAFPQLRVETLLIVLILIAAVFTRFYHIDLRVMSHDETNHVWPAGDYYDGRGYQYNPVTHGPLQFHLLAGSFFLLGANDFSARVPYALFSIATVAVGLLAFKRYLGRRGALFAGLMLVISPMLLFYGRYTRNEAFEGLWTLLTIYAILRYLEKGEKSALILLTVVSALHFSDKATSYIYTAQALMFLALFFLDQVLRLKWRDEAARRRFIALMGSMLILVVIALGAGVQYANATGVPLEEGSEAAPVAITAGLRWLRALEIGGLALAALSGLAGLVTLVRTLGWKMIRRQRSFDLLMLLGALVLPLLAAFPVGMVGWNPLDYSMAGMLRTALFLVPLAAAGVALGLWWNPRTYLTCLAIFLPIFTVLYTSFFTNGAGFFAGLVGALGYWLSQQGVQRGSQPWYYYTLVQIPIYEYLPAIGALVALYFGLRYRRFLTWAGFAPAQQPEQEVPLDLDVEAVEDGEDLSTDGLPSPMAEEVSAPVEQETQSENCQDSLAEESAAPRRVPVLALLLFWTFTSLVAFSLAGEKMPWLTLHIATPMILAAGWGFGFMADTTDWKRFGEQKSWLALLLLPVFVASAAGVFTSTLGGQLPFQGKELEQLKATGNFVMALAGLIFSGWGITHFLRDLRTRQLLRIFASAFAVLFAVLTARTAFTASYINYDLATEFLVYAHGGNGPKQMLAQIEEISRRTTDGLGIQIAYDNDGIYPFRWYLRDYPNATFYGNEPTRDLREKAIVIVSDNNYARVDPLLNDNFIYYQYQRLWWPMQDYFDLSAERVWAAIKNPQMRQAVFDIWLNRDYKLYAELEGRDNLTLENWYPAASIRMYIRKDIVSQIWNFGAAPVAPIVQEDPYEKGKISLTPDKAIGAPGSEAGQLNAPRGLAVAPDGTIYVADSRNNRIQHFSPDGSLLQEWGGITVVTEEDPGVDGLFNEPWGVAVGPDGSVYVTDTWNHRIQKFTADGKFVAKWGFFGTAEAPNTFWGPRGIAVDSQGRVYVADTGNKRIVIFTADGQPITQFGGPGYEAGKLDEPVGVAVDANGLVYVTDTWNQRIQVFSPSPSGDFFTPLRQWDVSAWYGQSLDNKPFIAVNRDGDLFVNDPEGYRILQFTADGVFVRTWGDPSSGLDGFRMPAGVAIDSEGHLWVSDAVNNVILRFTLP